MVWISLLLFILQPPFLIPFPLLLLPPPPTFIGRLQRLEAAQPEFYSQVASFPSFLPTHPHSFDLTVTYLIISCTYRQGDEHDQPVDFMYSAINLFDTEHLHTQAEHGDSDNTTLQQYIMCVQHLHPVP